MLPIGTRFPAPCSLRNTPRRSQKRVPIDHDRGDAFNRRFYHAKRLRHVFFVLRENDVIEQPNDASGRHAAGSDELNGLVERAVARARESSGYARGAVLRAQESPEFVRGQVSVGRDAYPNGLRIGIVLALRPFDGEGEVPILPDWIRFSGVRFVGLFDVHHDLAAPVGRIDGAVTPPFDHDFSLQVIPRKQAFDVEERFGIPVPGVTPLSAPPENWRQKVRVACRNKAARRIPESRSSRSCSSRPAG